MHPTDRSPCGHGHTVPRRALSSPDLHHKRVGLRAVGPNQDGRVGKTVLGASTISGDDLPSEPRLGMAPWGEGRRLEGTSPTMQCGGLMGCDEPRMPELMPQLSPGGHRSPRKGACFMELASYLAGERWSDPPGCTHP